MDDDRRGRLLGVALVLSRKLMSISSARSKVNRVAGRKRLGERLAFSSIGSNAAHPYDWKPAKTVGPGVGELRVSDAGGAFPVVYIASFADAIYVLHAFQKQTQRTAKRELDMAVSRLRDLARGRR
jgi:phage-related protein